ncbi:MAG: hypothetical protein IE933_07425 [Sphingomonadales bacterium]|nr:hypothetical protein [Sphingomonadales bacterium]MBD3773486.1 hypothetical protein [Paracoccaceae bacterium]
MPKRKSVPVNRVAKKAHADVRDDTRNTAGISRNPATNIIMADIAMRAGTAIVRRAVEKKILGRRYTRTAAQEIVKNRTLTQTAARAVAARVATRSVPGALLVGGGLLAKVWFDWARGQRDSRLAGDRALLSRSDELMDHVADDEPDWDAS